MRLENILALTKGTLYSNPNVTLFENLVFDVSKVKRGSLFAAYNPRDIQEALANGAYGILFYKPTQMGDSDVACIKVDSIDEAVHRLLRVYLLEKELLVYHGHLFTLHIL